MRTGLCALVHAYVGELSALLACRSCLIDLFKVAHRSPPKRKHFLSKISFFCQKYLARSTFEIAYFCFWRVFRFFSMCDVNRSCHTCATLRWEPVIRTVGVTESQKRNFFAKTICEDLCFCLFVTVRPILGAFSSPFLPDRRPTLKENRNWG